jgi:hypothetical protein
MQPLIDSDVLHYEIGFAAEAGWQGEGVPSFDYVAELLDMKIANICAVVEATQPPILFMTEGRNFRTEVAKLRPYKERAGNKPFHFYNIKAYIKAKYEWRSQDGLEADDLMAIEQSNRLGDTIICTRDKDAKQVPGLLYSWELGNQPQLGPLLVDRFGGLSLSKKRNKLEGFGEMFFLGQCLTGDVVDTVPGLPKCGPVKAFDILNGAVSYEDAFNRVFKAYQEHYGERAEEELLEQGRLLYMSRRFENGKVLLWGFPTHDYEEWYDINTRQIEKVLRVQP